jgi:hypothetical protein
MNEQIIKDWWLAAGQDQSIGINPIALAESIHKKIAAMEKQVRRRNFIEILVCLIMIPIFVWQFIKLPQIIGKTGSAIIVLACILVIFKLFVSGRLKTDHDNTSEMAVHLQWSLKQVKQQIRLLESVIWWYLLPFFVGVLCFFYAFPVSIIIKILYSISVAIGYSYIYIINKRVVSRNLKPLESGIKNALAHLTDESI